MRRPAPTVTAAGCSTHITLDAQYPQCWNWSWRQVSVDEAHTLVEAPYVVVDAERFECPNWATDRNTIETGWFVGALAPIEDEAQSAVERALEALRADIAAGNIAKGAHRQYVASNPLEPPVEAELRAYRERVLRGLGAS